MRLWARIKHRRIYTRNKWTLNLQAAPLGDYQHRTRPLHWRPTGIERAPQAMGTSAYLTGCIAKRCSKCQQTRPTTIQCVPHATGASSLPHQSYRKPALKTSAKKTYDHPACPPRNGRFPQRIPTTIQRVPHATGSLQVHISGSSQAALFRANSSRRVPV
jgi:hypothetical protein